MKIQVTIDRIEGDKVVLEFPDLTYHVWTKTLLPSPIKEGQKLLLQISPHEKGS